eukprot:TRINITY_DN12683_c0_g1_i1.p1 TRINITY_DN12683_c0_g1~~TRINITY_DN12683_c0_g1_i1.p1  ORF type:complete len:249 (-),score=13.60 TRINITY_DN12683_c0_g1_i1:128-874(-)
MEQANKSTNYVRKVQRILISNESKLWERQLTFLVACEGNWEEHFVKRKDSPAKWKGCKVITLPETDPHFIKVKKLFDQSMKGKYTHLIIKKLVNRQTWYLFCEKLKEIKTRDSKGQKIEIRLLFHGTGKNDPKMIYGGYDKSFDLQCARKGMWGKGIYFAARADYSCNSPFVHQSGGLNYVLLAKVIVGNFIDYKYNSDSELVHAPVLSSDTKRRYDSVKACVSNTDIYVVYETHQAYPSYLISYVPL